MLERLHFSGPPPMVSLSGLERLLEGAFAPATCEREDDYHALWHERDLNAASPADIAIAGGAFADRPAWVFAAGYQATLRNAFTRLPPDGWAAFAATEDEADPVAHPGTTLAEDGDRLRLDGCKAWVGHSRLVEHLIVTVNDPGGDKRKARGVVVRRDAPGVTLTHRAAPGFLAVMSQGYARFERTPVEPGAVMGFEPIRQFGRTEAKFVMLAATAFMLVRAPGPGPLRDELTAITGALVALLAEAETSRQAYGAIDRAFQRCVDRFEAEGPVQDIPDYGDDARLFRMYTDRIQRRVGYARAELAAR